MKDSAGCEDAAGEGGDDVGLEQELAALRVLQIEAHEPERQQGEDDAKQAHVRNEAEGEGLPEEEAVHDGQRREGEQRRNHGERMQETRQQPRRVDGEIDDDEVLRHARERREGQR